MNMQVRFPSQQASILRSVELDTPQQPPTLRCVNSGPKPLCKHCALRKICLAKSVDEDSLEALSTIKKHPKPMQKGQHFYRQDDALESVYILRSGAVKTYYIDDRGEEHITGICLPGELFGSDGIGRGRHRYSAIALDTSAICEFPYKSLEQSFQSHPDIQRRVMEMLCSEIYDRQEPLLSLRKIPAEERLATFLTDISSRLKLRGLSPTEFSLPMSRRDIARYLGVAEETMSRLFTRFQNWKLLAATGRSVSISDLPALQDMSMTRSKTSDLEAAFCYSHQPSR